MLTFSHSIAFCYHQMFWQNVALYVLLEKLLHFWLVAFVVKRTLMLGEEKSYKFSFHWELLRLPATKWVFPSGLHSMGLRKARKAGFLYWAIRQIQIQKIQKYTNQSCVYTGGGKKDRLAVWRDRSRRTNTGGSLQLWRTPRSCLVSQQIISLTPKTSLSSVFARDKNTSYQMIWSQFAIKTLLIDAGFLVCEHVLKSSNSILHCLLFTLFFDKG